MAATTISERFAVSSTCSSVSGSSHRNDEVASSSFLPSCPWIQHRHRRSRLVLGSSLRPAVKVNAVVGYPATISWWKKGEKLANMREITSSEQLFTALARAALDDKLVLVDFYSAGCRSCKAMHPKVCQLASENPNMEVLTVNFYDNIALCRSLNVNVLPFFHFYRGAEGRLGAFSCSLSKIDKLRAAVVKYQGNHHALPATNATPLSDQQTKLSVLPAMAAVASAV